MHRVAYYTNYQPSFCQFKYLSFDLTKAWLGLYRLCYLCIQLFPTPCFIVIVQNWRWQSRSSLLYFGGSMQCVVMCEYFFHVCLLLLSVLCEDCFSVSSQTAATPFYFPPFFHSRNLSNFRHSCLNKIKNSLNKSSNLYICIRCRYYYQCTLRLPT